VAKSEVTYYSELTDVQEYWKAIEIPAMEVLTSRIERHIGKEKMTLSQEIENLERVLKQADLVCQIKTIGF
jgi:hypothetical protein